MSLDSPVLAELHASQGRRWIGVICLSLLGVMLLGMGLTLSDALVSGRLMLLGLGAASLWVCWRMFLASARYLVLTENALLDSAGRHIAFIDDITALDRGVFAFKPSGGFSIKTHTRQSRVWQPGMWWRAGRQIGIGGISAGHQAKAMAAIIEYKINTRTAGDDQGADL